MKALYFASVRERIGKNEEEIDPPATVVTVGDLVDWLTTRDEGYAEAFASGGRCARRSTASMSSARRRSPARARSPSFRR